MDLSRVIHREKLAPRREPYWQRLGSGQFIGYRPSKSGVGGTWIARYIDPQSGRKPLHSLGDYGNLPPNERFGVAVKEARAWLEHVDAGGSTKPVTVKEVCERYVGAPADADEETVNRLADNKYDAHVRFHRHVYSDPIAPITLQKLTDRQVRSWRARLKAIPVIVKSKGGVTVTRERTESTLNRDMTPFRAALNLALENGDALTARAWKGALKPVEGADKSRDIYLDREQRRALLEKLPPDLGIFTRVLCLLPLRPGALAAVRVAHFDPRRSTLKIGEDKAGEGRTVPLPVATVAILKEQALNKLPGAWLFTRSDGEPWNKDRWRRDIKVAVDAASLPAAATIYAIRHSTITDLVISGLDLLTVAQVSGTSVAMIEKHYGHLRKEHAAAALAQLHL